MCMPKAPKMEKVDPQIKADQKAQREMENERLKAEKKKAVVAKKRTMRGSGVRSLLTENPSGDLGGFGSNY